MRRPRQTATLTAPPAIIDRGYYRMLTAAIIAVAVAGIVASIPPVMG